jgi:8-oxo-dGTP pyrophosphatase MutT (NUDIX family)
MFSSPSEHRFLEHLQRALQLPPVSRLLMRSYQPELAYGRHYGPAVTHAKQGAVLLLLFPQQHDWQVVLTVRQQHLLQHAGQISLPGGKCDPQESSADTALREYREEVGPLTDYHLLGALPEVYIYASNFLVTPYMAITPHRPVFRPNPAEVADVLTVSLHAFLDAQRRGRHEIVRGPLRFFAPCFRIGQRSLWGATWIILGELLERLQSLGPVGASS